LNPTRGILSILNNKTNVKIIISQISNGGTIPWVEPGRPLLESSEQKNVLARDVTVAREVLL
jgi:hypothetical protein